MMLARLSAVAMAAALLLPLTALAADAPAKGPDAVGPGYEYYVIGDITAPTPGKTGPLLALMGGGDWPLEAFHQFVKQSGGGHIVVLGPAAAENCRTRSTRMSAASPRSRPW